MARYGPFWPQSGEYAFAVIDLQDEIRDLMFDSHDLIELGQRWGIIKRDWKERRSKVKGSDEKKLSLKGLQHDNGARRGQHKNNRKRMLEGT